MTFPRPSRLLRAAAVVSMATLASALPAGAGSKSASLDPPPPGGQIGFTAADSIPVNGFGVPELAPVKTALRDYVRQRCAGAATVGVSYQGTVLAEWGVGRENGRAGSILDPACGTESTDPYDPSAGVADQYTPMRIGSVSKTMSAAVLRWSLKRRYHELTGNTLTDDALEAMPLLGNDFPGGLIPDDLRQLLAGEVPVPTEITECDSLGGVADPRWHDVTVGHLLAHRAGLQRSAPDTAKKTIPALPVLRGLDAQSDFEAQHASVRDASGNDAAVDGARDALQGADPDPVYFIEPPTMVEVLKMLAGRCLEFQDGEGAHVTVGTFHYSNTDPTFWTVIMEHVTGTPFAGAVGDADSHAGSLLQQFFQTELGLNSFGDAGVFRQPATIDPGEPNVMPNPRHWSPSENTLRPSSEDEKRPSCRYENGTCSFEEWLDGDRANWNWALEQVPFDRAGVGVGAATGGLAIRPRFMLAFMNKFRAGGYDANPTIGEARTAWTQGANHTGEMSGARAAVLSYSGNSNATFKVPAVGPDGHLTDDLDHLVSGSFDVPSGLDVFVSVNQSTDPKCQASAALNAKPSPGGRNVIAARTATHYDCDTAYGVLDDYVLYGLSQVDWDALIPSLGAGPATPAVPLGPGQFTQG